MVLQALLAEAPGTPPYGDTGTPLLEERAPFAEGRARAAESPTLEQPGTPRGHQDDAPAAMPAGIALFSDFMGAGQEPEAKLEPQNQPHQADLDAGSSTRSSHGMAAAPTAPVPLVELPPRAAEAVSVALPPAKADVSPFGGYPPMPPGMESPAAPGALPTHRDHSGGDVWAEIPRGVGQGVHIDRSHTMRSAASDRRLPRVEEEEMQPMASTGACVRLALKLDVVAGPCSETSYVTGEDTAVVSVGRAGDNHLVLHDAEVSGRHITISWSPMGKCWQVADLGSLNGSLLNGESITGGKASPAPSTSLGSAGSATANGSGAGGARARGENFRLSTDDILQLGSATRLKVSVFPREMLPENSNERAVSLSLGSFPRSLTMPKHRVPSFSSLLSPKINSSPSKHAVVAAASDELRLECCIASATGRDHARKGETIEDVASAECPLRGSETALGGSTAGLFCVFDGHCGRGAADAASAVLPEEVSARLPVVKDVMEAGSEGAGAHGALHAAFLATDKRIAAEEGCTATAVLAWSGAGGAVHLQAANVGDSAALLIDPGSGSWKVLTEDHRLTNPAERERLARTGIPVSSHFSPMASRNGCCQCVIMLLRL